MPKIQQSKSQKRGGPGSMWVIIPSDICKLKGWKKGTVLEFREQMGAVCIMEVR